MATASYESTKITRTIRNEGRGDKMVKSSTVTVQPHIRNIGGKLVAVSGYSYRK